jgi:hypothetical protein
MTLQFSVELPSVQTAAGVLQRSKSLLQTTLATRGTFRRGSNGDGGAPGAASTCRRLRAGYHVTPDGGGLDLMPAKMLAVWERLGCDVFRGGGPQGGALQPGGARTPAGPEQGPHGDLLERAGVEGVGSLRRTESSAGAGSGSGSGGAAAAAGGGDQDRPVPSDASGDEWGADEPPAAATEGKPAAGSGGAAGGDDFWAQRAREKLRVEADKAPVPMVNPTVAASRSARPRPQRVLA